MSDCVPSNEHPGLTGEGGVKVWVSPGSEGPYGSFAAALPAGTVLVKERYDDAACEVVVDRWAMRKEPPGTDPEAGDWTWQHVDERRRVVPPASGNCVACHDDAGCVERDYTCLDARN